MTLFANVLKPHIAARLALVVAAAGMLAGCANSERLGDPLSNPFQTSATGSAPSPGYTAAAPVAPVQSRPLAAPTASTYAPPPPPPSQPGPRIAVSPLPSHGQSVAGWSAQGGSPVVVAQGESAAILANRYGVPVEALVRTNGFSSASQIQPGSHIVIPVYNAALAASSGAKPPPSASAKAPKAAALAAPAKVRGEPPRTLAEQAAKLKSDKAKAAASKSAAKEAPAKPARQIARHETEKPSKPAQKTASVTPAPGPAPNGKPEAAHAVKSAKLETPGEAPKATPAAAPAEPAKQAAATPTAQSTPAPEFRWPARGRIIQGFKPGGNDGINIAVPEGTSVKAAESGVVAYAGNELKGYGNLILIRHPNGFVSAYANTGDIEVKRGDTVKRGQTIAKSGQTGNVTSPQLHFELRKGTTPVDPTQYLAGA
ncbi:MAG TPA: LysM peptidoglycan-binding domain-containing M23 family metallopeptidase [Methylocella sp.]|nr:LysM peptidoglycan-binding domain-containing M23 family metallopeptidase [Methylocella sp.]